VVESCIQPQGFVSDNTDCDDSITGGDRYPGAPEVCDGKDNNCDVETGLLVDDDDPAVDYTGLPTYYDDLDDDGYGDPASAYQLCAEPTTRYVLNGDDCNDASGVSFPGGIEICDGLDNNCDGVEDDDDWMVPSHPYRIPMDVITSTRNGTGVPITLEVDFTSELAALGDTSAADLSTVRMVHQDCAYGFPELPVEAADDLANLFGTGDLIDPVGDGYATVVTLYDEDGNFATREGLNVNERAPFAIYFGSEDNPASEGALAYDSPLLVQETTSTLTLRTGVSRVTLDGESGGLANFVGVGGKPSVASQASSAFGNGMLLSDSTGSNGEWVNSRGDANGILEIVHEGPVVSVISGSGLAEGTNGSFESRYTWIGFAVRPEYYVKVRAVLETEVNVGPQSPYWTSAVRPYQIDNLDLINDVGGSAEADSLAFSWAHGSYDEDTYGVFLGYRTNPLHLALPVVVSSGRYVSLAAQHVQAIPSDNQVALSAGTTVLDDNTLVVYPHLGSQASVTEQFVALARGVTVLAEPAEAQ
jgi:hypothetical protein